MLSATITSNANSPKCISIIRYLAEAGDRVPLDTHSRIVQKLNFPQLIVELLDNQCPWIDGSKFEVYFTVVTVVTKYFKVHFTNQGNGKSVIKY